MTDVAYVDIRPVLAKIADLERELVFVGGQAVNFWTSFYQRRVPALGARQCLQGGMSLAPGISVLAGLETGPRVRQRCAWHGTWHP